MSKRLLKLLVPSEISRKYCKTFTFLEAIRHPLCYQSVKIVTTFSQLVTKKSICSTRFNLEVHAYLVYKCFQCTAGLPFSLMLTQTELLLIALHLLEFRQFSVQMNQMAFLSSSLYTPLRDVPEKMIIMLGDRISNKDLIKLLAPKTDLHMFISLSSYFLSFTPPPLPQGNGAFLDPLLLFHKSC